MKRLFFAIALCALLAACDPGGVYNYEVYTAVESGDTCVRDTLRGSVIVRTDKLPRLGLMYENGGWSVFGNWCPNASYKIIQLNIPEGAEVEGFGCERVDWVKIGGFSGSTIYPKEKRRKYKGLYRG